MKANNRYRPGNFIRNSILTLCLIIGWIVIVNAGVVFQVETIYHSGSPGPESYEMSVEKPNLKMEISASDGSKIDAVIFKADRREMVTVNHRDKTYMIIDEGMIDDMARNLQDAKEMANQMQIPQAVLDQMPESDRKKVEEMMNQKMGATNMSTMGVPIPKDEYRKTNERATKNGYPCVKYEVYRGNEKIRELWVTNFANVEGGMEMAEGLREMMEFFKKMQESFAKKMGASGEDNMFGDQNAMGDFFEIDGVPIVTLEYKSGVLVSTSTLKSSRKVTLGKEAFEYPSNYTLETIDYPRK